MIKKQNKNIESHEDDDMLEGYSVSTIDENKEVEQLDQELEKFMRGDDRKFANKSTLDIYFNEVNKHKLLTKQEERELGMIINENYKQILTCLCMTENIADFILQLRDTIVKTPFNELHKYIDVEYFGESYKPENHEKLIREIFLLINNFLNIHKAFLNKNKKYISSLQFEKLKGVNKVINAFSWMQIDRLYLDKLIDSIQNTVTSTQYHYTIVQKCRLNKKRKSPIANTKLTQIEKKFGMKFEKILLFIEHINKFRNEQNKAKNKMILSNLRLVIFAAHSFYDDSLRFTEMLSFGNLGLIKAIERFNFQLSNKFSTYAIWWVKHHIIRKIQKAKLIHVPSHLYEELQKFNRYVRKLKTQVGGFDSIPIEGIPGATPSATAPVKSAMTDEEICKQLNLDVDKIQRAKKESRSVKSLDVQIGDGSNEVTLSEVIAYKKSDLTKIYEEQQILQTVASSANYSFVSASTERCMRLSNLCKSGVQHQFIKRTSMDGNAANAIPENYQYNIQQYMYKDDEEDDVGSNAIDEEDAMMRTAAANDLSIKCKQRYLIQQMNSEKGITGSANANQNRQIFKNIYEMRPKLLDFSCLDRISTDPYYRDTNTVGAVYKLQIPQKIDLFTKREAVVDNLRTNSGIKINDELQQKIKIKVGK